MSYKKCEINKESTMWNYIKQKIRCEIKIGSQNKTAIAIPLITCLLLLTFAVSTTSIFSSKETKQSVQAEKNLYQRVASFIPTGLYVQLEHINAYLVQMSKDRHPGWIAGYAKPTH